MNTNLIITHHYPVPTYYTRDGIECASGTICAACFAPWPCTTDKS